MSMQSWQETIATIVADSTAVTGTAEALLVPAITLPANYMYPGRVIRASVKGLISNIVTTPGTVLFRARWSGLAGTVLAASAALTQNTAAQTNDAFELEFLITCRSVGTSGSMFTSGKIFQGNAPTAPTFSLIPATGNAVVTALDTTVAQSLALTAIFSLTGNSITANQYTLESLN